MNASSQVVPRLQVLAAAILFSTGGAAVKATELGGWSVAGLRAGVAALVLFALLGRSARRRPSRSELLVALAYAVALPGFVLANKLTTAASTVFLYSTAPFWVLLLAPWLLGEARKARDLILMGSLLVAGGLLLLWPDAAVATASHPVVGNWVAVCSGFVWALTVVGLRWLSRRRAGGGQATGTPGGLEGGAVRAVVWGNALAFLLTSPLTLKASLFEASAQDVGAIVYLGVVQIGLAYFLLLAGLRHVPAFETSLLLLAEPVLSPVWAWWLHGEVPGPWVVAGGVVLVCALAIHAWAGRHGRPR